MKKFYESFTEHGMEIIIFLTKKKEVVNKGKVEIYENVKLGYISKEKVKDENAGDKKIL